MAGCSVGVTGTSTCGEIVELSVVGGSMTDRGAFSRE